MAAILVADVSGAMVHMFGIHSLARRENKWTDFQRHCCLSEQIFDTVIIVECDRVCVRIANEEDNSWFYPINCRLQTLFRAEYVFFLLIINSFFYNVKLQF